MQVLISAQTKGLNTALAQSSTAFKSFETSLTKANTLLTSFGIGLGAGVVANIAGEVIKVTAEFQKFGSVLANTLGSDSAAQAALAEIRVFAQETPFEVSEITAAYVRWANQGLNPTIDKMSKLGDISSSLGAGFEQTAEAFKDLLVGQTKRIEEIGISAQQSNGKIQLSFKGVNLEIDKTVEGVEEALNVFSALQGVQGTSAQVAETLGGRISNLKDAYSNLLLTVGTANGSILKDTVDIFIGITNAASTLISKLTDTNTTLGQTASLVVQNFTFPLKAILALTDNTEEANKKLEENNAKLKAIQSTADAAFASGNIEAYIKALDQNINKEEIIAEIRRRQAEEIAKVNAARATEIVTLDSLKKKLDELNDQFETTDKNDKVKLSNIATNIFATNAQIEALEKLRKKTEEVGTLQTDFAKQQAKDAEDRLKGVIVPTREITPFDAGVDTGALLQQQEVPPLQLDAYFASLQEMTAATQAAGVANINSIDQQVKQHELIVEAQQRSAESALAIGDAVGTMAGEVIKGNKNILQVILQTTGQLLKTFLSQAIGGMIAGAGKTAAPPPVIIALAAAGVAAISALFKSATGFSGGGGAGAGGAATTNVSRIPAVVSPTQQQEIKFRLEGPDLAATMNTNNGRINNRLGG